jgi:hypothetical protein
MLLAPVSKDPVVLSYLSLRRAVGAIAFALPFVVAIPPLLFRHTFETSISMYYYTGTRNVFVGGLCAVAMFMLGCRGYDIKDELAGLFSAICALGVAFFPTSPDCATPLQKHVGIAHYTFAGALFLTLAYFCLVLFRMSAVGKDRTPKKVQRNLVYTICGVAILVSIGLLLLLNLVFGRTYLIGKIGTTFVFETTSLLSFGVAWLVKGGTFLKDAAPQQMPNITTDDVFRLATK